MIDAAATPLTLTRHAESRARQRQVPPWVMCELVARPFMAQARVEGILTYFRIVRVSKGRYWVGVERNNHLATVIPVVGMRRARSWFKRRILNYKVMMRSIERMPTSRSGRTASRHAEPGWVSESEPRGGSRNESAVVSRRSNRPAEFLVRHCVENSGRDNAAR